MQVEIRNAIVGFVIGAAIPVTFGVYVIHDFYAAIAAEPPGVAACGMPFLFGFAVILFGGPLGGVLGSAIALAGSLVATKNRRISGSSRDN